MKAVFKKVGENVSYYNRATKGYLFIATVETSEQFYNEVMRLEDTDYFPQEDGRVLSANGNEIYDPNYPLQFDDVDYNYSCEKVAQICPNQYDVDAAKLKAIEDANPFNLAEIRATMDMTF